MKTINIKGKEYVQVNERIKHFRSSEKYEGYSLTSEILRLEADFVVIKGIIKNKEGQVVAEGIAAENKGSSPVNKTSFIENCETSAWGRALGNLGIGIDASIASAEEVENAIKGQSIDEKIEEVDKIIAEEIADEVITFGKKFSGKKFKDVNFLDLKNYVDYLESGDAPKGKALDFVRKAKAFIESKELVENVVEVPFEFDEVEYADNHE